MSRTAEKRPSLASRPWSPAFWAAAVFAVLMARPAAVALLRDRAARTDPAWASNPANGRFAVLTPHLIGTRYFDESAYAARVHQVQIHGVPYTPYWREFRGLKHWLHEFIPYYLMAGAAAIVGGDLNLAWVTTAAVVGAGWFLLWFFFLLWACGRDHVAVPLALVMTLFPDIGFWLLDVNLDAATMLARWKSAFLPVGAHALPHYHRLYSMHLSFLFVCLLLTGLWRLAIVQRPRSGAAVSLGLCFAAMAFVHSFEFALGMAVISILPFAAWAFGLPEKARRALWTALGAALAGAAAYALLDRSMRGPEDVRLLMKLTHAVPGRRFHPMTIIHLAAAAWMWSRARRERTPGGAAAWLVLASAQAGVFLWRNAELLLGLDIQFFHFLPMAGTLAAAGLLVALSRRLAASPRWTRRAALGAATAAAALAATRDLAYARSAYRELGLPADAQAAYEWLDANAPTDALLLTPSMRVNMEAPIYTRVKVEAPPLNAPVLVIFGMDEYLTRVARLLKTLRVDPARFADARWLPPAAKAAVHDRVTSSVMERGEADLDALEEALWFYAEAGASEQSASAGRRRLVELYGKSEPLTGPYYIWLDKRDRALLSELPERRGLRPVFARGSVSLYFVPTPRALGRTPPWHGATREVRGF